MPFIPLTIALFPALLATKCNAIPFHSNHSKPFVAVKIVHKKKFPPRFAFKHFFFSLFFSRSHYIEKQRKMMSLTPAAAFHHHHHLSNAMRFSDLLSKSFPRMNHPAIGRHGTDSEDKPWHRNATSSSLNLLHFSPFTFFRVASLVEVWGKFKLWIKINDCIPGWCGGDHNVYRRRQTTLSNRVHYVHKGRTLPLRKFARRYRLDTQGAPSHSLTYAN